METSDELAPSASFSVSLVVLLSTPHDAIVQQMTRHKGPPD